MQACVWNRRVASHLALHQALDSLAPEAADAPEGLSSWLNLPPWCRNNDNGVMCMYNASRDRATLRISLLQPVFAMSELNSRKLLQMTEKSSRD